MFFTPLLSLSLSHTLSQIIKHLRTAEFKPFIVFVKPPSIEKLKETRQNGKVRAGKDDSDSAKPFTVRECLCSVFSNKNDEPDGPDGFCLDLSCRKKSALSVSVRVSACGCVRTHAVRSGSTRL